MLKRCLRIFSLMLAIACLLNLTLYTLGYAQDSEPSAPWWKPLLNMLVLSVLPALWAAIGPLTTAWITKQVNRVSVYVPRPVQVALSGVVTAALAGLTGDPAGLVEAGLEGATGQVLAATNPETLRTTAPR